MALDNFDHLLIKRIKADARQPIQTLANKLGLKSATVRYRLNRLIDDGILKIACVTNSEVLGYRSLVVIGIKVFPGKAEAVANQLAPLPEVRSVFVTAGRFNILAWMLFRNQSDLGNFVSEDLPGIADITDVEIMNSYRWEPYSWSFSESKKEFTQSDLSKLELSVVRAMREAPRQSITKLAQTVGCSRAVAKATLEKLTNDGIVKFNAFVDPTSIGYDTGVAIFIKAQPDKIDAVAKKLSKENTETHVNLISGQWHIYFRAHFQDSEHLQNFLLNTLAGIPGVVAYDVVHLVRTVKFSVKYSFSPLDLA